MESRQHIRGGKRQIISDVRKEKKTDKNKNDWPVFTENVFCYGPSYYKRLVIRGAQIAIKKDPVSIQKLHMYDIFQNKHIPFSFLMHNLCTTGSLYCGIVHLHPYTHLPCTVDT